MDYVTYYKVVDKKRKTMARGFWGDNKTGKLYYDYIERWYCLYEDFISHARKTNEKAVFYTQGLFAYVIDMNNGYKTCFQKRKKWYTDKKNLRTLIKSVILLYGGCTVFKLRDEYIIEVWN